MLCGGSSGCPRGTAEGRVFFLFHLFAYCGPQFVAWQSPSFTQNENLWLIKPHFLTVLVFLSLVLCLNCMPSWEGGEKNLFG